MTQVHWSARLLAAAACSLALFSAPGQAETWAQWRQGLQGLSPEAGLRQLQQAPAEFRELADYFYWLGVFTLKANGPVAQASEHFEHALMLDPEHAGAWYDYGLSLCKGGQYASCQTVLNTAQERFGPPPLLKDATPPRFFLTGEARSHVGYSSNLNAGSRASELTLWLGGEAIPMQLASASRAQGAAFADAGIDLKVVPAENPQLAMAFSAFGRRPLQQRATIGDYSVLAGEISYATTPTQRIGMQAYAMNDTELGSLQVFNTWWQFQRQPGDPRALLVAERRLPDGHLPDYSTLRAEVSYPIWRRLTGRFAIEQDLAENDRPGRSQRRWLAEVTLPLQILGKGSLDISGRWLNARDSAPYSAFFGDTRRKSDLWETRLQFSWPLADGIALRSEARYTRVDSNLALYNQSERMVMLGLAFRF